MTTGDSRRMSADPRHHGADAAIMRPQIPARLLVGAEQMHVYPADSGSDQAVALHEGDDVRMGRRHQAGQGRQEPERYRALGKVPRISSPITKGCRPTRPSVSAVPKAGFLWRK